jgi:hypothetical protein
MKRRYYPPRKPDCSNLFKGKEYDAKLLYLRCFRFRDFVYNWRKDDAELLGWTLVDFYRAYCEGWVQPTLF